MTINVFDDLSSVTGNERLTVPEKIGTFIKETSLKIDAFNAKKFNKSIHKVEGAGIYRMLSNTNRYFDLATKQIPSPVFFNPSLCTFEEYVKYVLNAVLLTNIVGEECDRIYRVMKNAAAKGSVQITAVESPNQDLINQMKADASKRIFNAENYSLPVNKLFSNFNLAYDLVEQFNKTVDGLKSRDPEIVSKQADEILRMAKMLKSKIERSEMAFSETELYTLTKLMEMVAANVEYLGVMLTYLNETTRVLQIQIESLEKMK